jgi:hypothetical protein
LQGPHHSAQKSSRTGLSDLRTSCVKVASVVCTMLLGDAADAVPGSEDVFGLLTRFNLR